MKLLQRLRTLGLAICLAIPVILLAAVIARFSIAALKRHGVVDPLSIPAARLSEKVTSEKVVMSSRIAKLCFVRGDRIYLLNLSTGKETKLIEGKRPDLSPAGDAVAYMSPELQGSNDSSQIKLLDLRTKQTWNFSTLANLRAFGPRWSNDGTRIAFELINADATRLDIGLINPSTGDWQNITKSVNLGNPAEAVTLDSWVSGDQSILFHGLENLYEVGLDGTLLQKIPIASFCSPDSISSGTRFFLSSDRKYLLFDRIISTSEDPENEIISIFDLNVKKLSRVTPNTIEARRPVWLPSQKEMLFTCLKRFARPYQPSICKIAIDGTGLTTLVGDGDFASYATR